MASDSSGNLAVDFVWGNFPIQPNTERSAQEKPLLSIGNSHKTPSVGWNNFPNYTPNAGHTFVDGDPYFIFPDLWACSNGSQFHDVTDVINELVSYGVPRAYFKDFTFSGGETEWDASGTPNWDGAILYSYIPANIVVTTDYLNTPIFGSAFNNKVFGGNWNGGNTVSVDTGNPEDYMLYVFSNDPRKNNVGWWW